MSLPADTSMPTTDYDLLPYMSLPVCHTQPAHLAAAALLNGIELPDAEAARILELGCASGGNIIPLAVRFPDATFLGIDLGRRHIEEGQKRIASLGLPNIEIFQADLTTVSFDTQTFDYVICHGVFSWVPSDTREAILRLCNQHLAANGAAIVSYNVLPGWHLRGAIRDICLRFASAGGSPLTRVSKARDALNDMASASPAATPYGQLLRQEAARIAKLPASYILGEFLAEHNDPLHFDEFLGLAAGHGLAFLSEATLGTSAAAKWGDASPNQPANVEQYADYVSGRPFRRTLLIRSKEAASIRRPASADHLHRLHFSPQIEAMRKTADGPVADIEGEAGQMPVSKDGAEAWILAQFTRKGPSTLTLQQLAARAEAEGMFPEDGAVEAVRTCLFRLVMADVVSISTVPLIAGSASAKHPRLWQVALAESTSRQPWLTSLAHTAVPLPRLLRVIAPLINGERNLTELTAHTVAALNQGTLTLADLRGAERQGTNPEIVAIAAGAVAKALDYLARNALLAPDSR